MKLELWISKTFKDILYVLSTSKMIRFKSQNCHEAYKRFFSFLLPTWQLKRTYFLCLSNISSFRALLQNKWIWGVEYYTQYSCSSDIITMILSNTLGFWFSFSIFPCHYSRRQKIQIISWHEWCISVLLTNLRDRNLMGSQKSSIFWTELSMVNFRVRVNKFMPKSIKMIMRRRELLKFGSEAEYYPDYSIPKARSY